MAKKAKKIKKAVVKKKVVQQKKPVSAMPSQQEIPLKKTKIRVIGVGGGGGSIVSEIASRISKASFVAVNTDSKALKEVNRRVTHFHFGENLTHGLGTGMNAEIGEQAAIEEKERFEKLFEGQDFCIFVACLGGGTGSGATKVLAKMAKAAGCITYGIFTLPFNFEGDKKGFIAKTAMEDIKSKLHAYSVIPNERIFQIIQKETPLRQALSAINSQLASSLEGLIEIIYEPGLINIDFADLRAILGGQGRLTYLNTVEVSRKEGAVQEAVDKLLNSPLYPYGIKGAKGVLYNIAGERGLTLYEVSQISKNISDLVNKEAKIIFGISQNQKYGPVIKTTVLATGCGAKIFAAEPLEAKRPEKKVQEPSKKENPAKPAIEKKKKKTLKTVKKNLPKKVPAKKQSSKEGKKSAKPAKPSRGSKSKKKKIKVKVVSKEQNPGEGGVVDSFSVETKNNEEPVRKNALQIKKEAEQQEAEMQAKERAWETPAFLRRKKLF
jgi:cell division protein FtsZ